MQHKKRRRGNKRGVTLMEMICVLALISVVTLFVSRLVMPAAEDYQYIVSADAAKQNVSVLAKEVESRLRYAAEAQITAQAQNEHCLYTQSGRLYDGGTQLFDEDAYGGLWYALSFQTAGAHAVKYSFFAWSGDPDAAASEFLYQGSFTVRLLNGSVMDTTGGADAVAYLVYSPAETGGAA